MASAIQMPKLSDTMTEGVIQKWLVKEGDRVAAGDPLAEVETDKATLEMEAYESGTILKILADPGKPAAVGAPIAVIGKPGEDWAAVAGGAPPAQEPAAAPAPAAATPPSAAPAGKAGDAIAVLMPKLSDTMTEGVIQKWLVKEGDRVAAGDPLAEVETDKATLEMEAYDSGTVLKIVAAAGKPAAVGAPIAVLGKPGADWQAALGAPAPELAEVKQEPPPGEARGEKVTWKPAKAGPAAAVPNAGEAAQPMRGPVGYPSRSTPGEIPGVTYGFGHTLAPAVPAAPVVNGSKVRASPVARKLAAERGLDLATIPGSGPAGRVVRSDVEQAGARPAARAQAAAPAPQADTVAMSMMRKAIARNLVEVKRNVPHFYLTIDVDMGAAVGLRAQAKAAEVPLSVNDLLLKAVAIAAQQVPRVQGQLVDENTIRVPRQVNLGMAVAVEDGLVTPVIQRAEALTVGEIARQARELATRARDKKLKPEDTSGGTITVSNLGMYEIEHFYAIISPGQGSIVSAGKVREEPVVKDGQIVVAHRLHLGYAGDHRVVDGAVGAQFLKALKAVLENPIQMLVG